jgi:hypothetical protein
MHLQNDVVIEARAVEEFAVRHYLVITFTHSDHNFIVEGTYSFIEARG